MPEYGREIQNMVNYCLTLPTKAERQRCANTIIRVMGNLFPQLRDTPDFTHKLWDHLAIMSGFKLDIDYPYEVIQPATLNTRPASIPYAQGHVHLRHYGKLVENALNHLAEMPDSPERDELIVQTANQMKRDMAMWNRNSLSDAKIFKDIDFLTKGKLCLDPARYHLIKVGMEMDDNPMSYNANSHKR